MRSFLPKAESFSDDLLNRSCSVSFLTEIWQKSENKKHEYKIEELLELKGLKCISSPRSGARRGGGVAIVADTQKFTISKLNIQIPGNLEVVWGLLRPIEVTGKITKIITCCFYCPPKSTKKTALIDHMTITLQDLLTTYPHAGVLISGDRNDLRIDRLLTLDPSLRQIVNKPTLRAKVLDIILTNMPGLYNEPEIVPPIPVDNPDKGGVPSDHSGVVVLPLSDTSKPVLRRKICRTVRPITSSSINNLGQVFVNENWHFMDPSLSSTDLTELFQYYTGQILDIFCPTKVCFVRPGEKPWVTENLKVMRRKVQREYERHGKTRKYSEMNQLYKDKLIIEMHKYKQKLEDDVINGERSSSYAAIRRLGARPGDPEPTATFLLPSHIDQNLTAVQSAEIIADHNEIFQLVGKFHFLNP